MAGYGGRQGRIEIPRYVLSDQPGWLAQKGEWRGLQTVGRVESTRIIGEQTATECRYDLSSVTDLERFADTVRGHRAIKNSQHWVLDVQFGEDAHRACKDHSPTNLALVRRMALNVIRHNGPSQHSLRIRELRVSLNDDYRFELIFGKLS
jgi:predicted transposase YbfD/YdcC